MEFLSGFMIYARNFYCNKNGETEKQFNEKMKDIKSSNDALKKYPELMKSYIDNVSYLTGKPNKIIESSKNELIRTAIRQGNEENIKKFIPEYHEGHELKSIVEGFKEINKKSNKAKRGPYKEKDKTEYYFITICPINKNASELIEIMSKILKRNEYFNICSYTYEQRGEENLTIGQGSHIHILSKKLVKKSVIIDQIYKSIHKLSNKESIDVKIIPESDRNKVELYMQGHKSPDKIKKVTNNIIWRKNNEIEQDIYCIDKKTVLKEFTYKQEKKECEIFYIGDETYIQVVINGEKKLVKI